MTKLRILFWTVFLPQGWYFIVIREGIFRTPMVVPAYWNGTVWESRTECIADADVWRVLGRIPALKDPRPVKLSRKKVTVEIAGAIVELQSFEQAVT